MKRDEAYFKAFAAKCRRELLGNEDTRLVLGLGMGRAVRRHRLVQGLPEPAAAELRTGHEVLVAAMRGDHCHGTRLPTCRRGEVSRMASSGGGLGVDAPEGRRISRVVRLSPPGRVRGPACERQSLQGPVPHPAHAGDVVPRLLMRPPCGHALQVPQETVILPSNRKEVLAGQAARRVLR